MENLLPLEPYERPFIGPAWRTVLAMAVLWGLPMTLLAVFTTYHDIGIALPLTVGVLAGLGFGFLWTRSFRRRMRTLMHRLYDADPALVPAPPTGPYQCRVSCNLVQPGRIAVGGHLYVGQGDWVFVPHRRNLPKHRSPITLPVSADIELTPRTAPPRGLARLFTIEPVGSIEVRSGPLNVRLYVPEPSTVAAQLRGYVQTRSETGGVS